MLEYRRSNLPQTKSASFVARQVRNFFGRSAENDHPLQRAGKPRDE
jgi:hypothetical protein